MKEKDALRRDSPRSDPWGVLEGYEDAGGGWHETPARTRRALLEAMGVGPTDPPPEIDPQRAAVRVVRRDQLPCPAPGWLGLRLEHGGERELLGELPADLPDGYHQLVPEQQDRDEQRLIITPGRCHLPPGLRVWAWAVQLYALRSTASWGIGDLGDLRRFARWAGAPGSEARMLLVSPLHAGTPLLPQQDSPYFPSSRRFRNPLYLRVEQVSGAELLGDALAPFAVAGRALDSSPRIDRDAVWRLKRAALQLLWDRFPGDEEYDEFRRRQGTALKTFAVWSALSEHHGRPWPQWPPEHRHPESPAVLRFASERRDQVEFHAWLQWQLERQLATVQDELPVMQDLPIGIDPAGMDAWDWQGLLARGATVGAPPDLLNVRGQDWGSSPFVPHALRQAAYQPFIEVVRSSLRQAGGLRIDHVMGLFRLYWIPAGAGPAAGAFVRTRADELLGILALESQRAGAIIVGEDLGTVEAGVRETLAAHDLLSYRLLWFEEQPPERWPARALAAVTTHDLPTIAGVWQGSDLRRQHELGLRPNVAASRALRQRLAEQTGLTAEASVAEVVQATHRLIARAPSVLLTATLEDALGVTARPNLPGASREQHPNWRQALPLPLEALEQDEGVRQVAWTLRDAVRAAPWSTVPAESPQVRARGGGGPVEVGGLDDPGYLDSWDDQGEGMGTARG